MKHQNRLVIAQNMLCILVVLCIAIVSLFGNLMSISFSEEERNDIGKVFSEKLPEKIDLNIVELFKTGKTLIKVIKAYENVPFEQAEEVTLAGTDREYAAKAFLLLYSDTSLLHIICFFAVPILSFAATVYAMIHLVFLAVLIRKIKPWVISDNHHDFIRVSSRSASVFFLLLGFALINSSIKLSIPFVIILVCIGIFWSFQLITSFLKPYLSFEKHVLRMTRGISLCTVLGATTGIVCIALSNFLSSLLSKSQTLLELSIIQLFLTNSVSSVAVLCIISTAIFCVAIFLLVYGLCQAIHVLCCCHCPKAYKAAQKIPYVTLGTLLFFVAHLILRFGLGVSDFLGNRSYIIALYIGLGIAALSEILIKIVLFHANDKETAVLGSKYLFDGKAYTEKTEAQKNTLVLEKNIKERTDQEKKPINAEAITHVVHRRLKRTWALLSEEKIVWIILYTLLIAVVTASVELINLTEIIPYLVIIPLKVLLPLLLLWAIRRCTNYYPLGFIGASLPTKFKIVTCCLLALPAFYSIVGMFEPTQMLIAFPLLFNTFGDFVLYAVMGSYIAFRAKMPRCMQILMPLIGAIIGKTIYAVIVILFGTFSVTVLAEVIAIFLLFLGVCYYYWRESIILPAISYFMAINMAYLMLFIIASPGEKSITVVVIGVAFLVSLAYYLVIGIVSVVMAIKRVIKGTFGNEESRQYDELIN